jgi:hypothetical protein
MIREELVIALKNALERGEDINRAMQTLISSGYDAQEVKEASQYTNNNVINEIVPIQSLPKINLKPISIQPPIQNKIEAPEAQQTYKKLPVQTQSIATPEPTEKRKIPRTLIWLIVIVIVLIMGLGLFIGFGEKFLDLIFKKV